MKLQKDFIASWGVGLTLPPPQQHVLKNGSLHLFQRFGECRDRSVLALEMFKNRHQST